MKRNGWQLLAGAVLAAILSGACVAPLNPGNDDAVEYDAQGRRLITIAVDPESAARAVNTPVAQTYIDFYEVVFKGPDGASEYYSATAAKGAGRRLSLRVPVGEYTAYLNAGYMEGDNEAVLLAQAAVTVAQPASTAWTFGLTALNLHINESTVTNPAATDPIYVTINSVGATTSEYQEIPYYAPAATTTVAVVVTTGVTNVVDFSANNIAVTPLIRKSDTPPVVISITTGPGPAFDLNTGKLTFGFMAPAASAVGVSNIGFDIEAALCSAVKRDNGKAPVRWHIRNGLTVDAYDNGKTTDASNTGAGLVFAFGGAKPTAQDEYEISFVPPIP